MEINKRDYELRYLAGVFDGEGSFSIQMQIKNYKGKESINFGPRMSMSLKYRGQVLNRLKEVFGGNIYEYPDGTGRWSMGGLDDLMNATEDLIPHLDIKKEIAIRFLETLEIFPTQRRKHRIGERTWTPELTRQVARVALTLNPPTAKKSKKNLDYLDRLDAIYKTEHTVDALLI